MSDPLTNEQVEAVDHAGEHAEAIMRELVSCERNADALREQLAQARQEALESQLKLVTALSEHGKEEDELTRQRDDLRTRLDAAVGALERAKARIQELEGCIGNALL